MYQYHRKRENALCNGQAKRSYNPLSIHTGRRKAFPHPSIAMLTNASVNPITGASQYTVATGVSILIFRFLNKICVRFHRNPPKADAEDILQIGRQFRW